MDGADPARIAARYWRFAAEEARGRSPLYEALAEGVAADPHVLEFLAGLPAGKRQPNLLLGVVRYLFGMASGYAEFRRRVLDNSDAVGGQMLSRSTQTNEPGRCAALLPVLARLPQPLALIEAGASAGLCLLPDCYGYDYGGHRLNAAVGGAGLSLRCRRGDAVTERFAANCLARRARPRPGRSC